MRNKPLVVAHEGCEGAAPHSLDSVDRGLDAGADAIEVDIRRTRDGVVVLRHDPLVLVDGEGVPVSELTSIELDELATAGRIGGERPIRRITRLEEVLLRVRERGAEANLDVKEDEVVDLAVRVVRETGMVDRVVFSGCEAPRARYLKGRYRECQVLLNVSETQYRVGAVDYEEFAESVCEEAVEAGCCALNLAHRFCREEVVTRAHRRFLAVAVWTVDEPEAMQRFLDLGVDAITTKRVTRLLRLR